MKHLNYYLRFQLFNNINEKLLLLKTYLLPTTILLSDLGTNVYVLFSTLKSTQNFKKLNLRGLCSLYLQNLHGLYKKIHTNLDIKNFFSIAY